MSPIQVLPLAPAILRSLPWPAIIQGVVQVLGKQPNVEHLGSGLCDLLENPEAAGTLVRRMGDAIVWQSDSGQRALAYIESSRDSMESISASIETFGVGQEMLSSAVRTVQYTSMFSLGVSSLTGALMLVRLEAMNRKLTELQQQIADIDAGLSALQKARAPRILLELNLSFGLIGSRMVMVGIGVSSAVSTPTQNIQTCSPAKSEMRALHSRWAARCPRARLSM